MIAWADTGPGWVLADLFRLDPRLDGKVESEAEGGCWVWTGARQKSGSKGTNVYGRLRRGGQLYLVHRWVYPLFFGAIPPDHEVHHLVELGCSSTCCINPRHLEAIHRDEHEAYHRELAASAV